MSVPLVLLAASSGVAAGLQITPSTLSVVEDAMRRLEKMWPGDGHSLLAAPTSSIPPLDGGFALQQRLQQRMRSQQPFVFAAFGSSVSAGHDNIMNQSWPFELERLLKPTFQALGFDFEMRQRAAGGYGEMPFAAGCMEARAGAGVDAVSWEWHMFRDSACEGHHFLAEAAAMASQPVVFGFADSSLNFKDNLQSGDKVDDEADTRRQILRERFMVNNDRSFRLPRPWMPNEWYLTEEFVSREELENWRQSGGVTARAEMRQGPEMVWLQETGVAQEFEKQGHGFYPVAISAASNNVVGEPWYQVREKAFNVNWHPGPLGHTLIASSIAHFMLGNLKTTLEGGAAPSGKRLSRESVGGPSLDNPLVGRPLTGTQDAPRCGSMVSRQCFTGLRPSTSRTLLDHRAPHAKESWVFRISDQAAERSTPAVDQRWVYHGTKENGELKLNFKSSEPGQYVVLCGAPCGWTCQGHAGYVSAKSQRWWPGHVHNPRKNVSDLTYTIDGREVPEAELLQLHDQLFDPETGQFCPGCSNPADLCQPVAKVDKGSHTVGISVEPRSREASDTFVEVLQMMLVGE